MGFFAGYDLMILVTMSQGSDPRAGRESGTELI